MLPAALPGVLDAAVLLGVEVAIGRLPVPPSDGAPVDVAGVKAPDALRLLRRACSAQSCKSQRC